MPQVNTGYSAEELRKLRPFQSVDPNLLGLLAEKVAPQWAPRGTRIIALGSDEDATYFLLNGVVRMVAADGGEVVLNALDESARRPLSHLRPRRYDVISETTIRFLRIDNRLLAGLSAPFADAVTRAMAEGVAAAAATLPALENELLAEMQEALDKDRLVLPSLPDIAVRVGRAVADENSNSKRIAAIVQTDPIISAKLVRAANSAFFGGQRTVESLTGAITQLGFKLTHKLVLSFALREIFNAATKAAQERMRELWRHSTQIGALCQMIARLDHRFEPQQALLAGLVHDIGVVAVITHLEQRAPHLEAALVDRVISHLRGPVGAAILRKWRFPDELVECALEGEEWLRDKSAEPDYCDVVVVAQLLGRGTGPRHPKDLPEVEDTRAYGKLRLGDSTDVDSGQSLLDQAREHLTHTENLLRA
jgi:HD-like signal output (HDOD) protein